jgi:capsular polysaccharide transport system permease protein
MTALMRQRDTTSSEAEVAKSPSELLQGIRRKRAQRLSTRLAIGVALPTLAAVIYYGLVATPQFESVSLFNIQSAETRTAPSFESFLGALPINSTVTRDTLTVRDYVLSRDVLKRLDADHGFIAHYQDPANDLISRLASDASFEDAFEYYSGKVLVDFDTNSGVSTLTVIAYRADKAQEFADAILRYSEEMVNALSGRARSDQMLFAEKELGRAEERLAKARQNLLRLQASRGEFSPEHSATETLGVRGGLQMELAKARAELLDAKSFLQPGAAKLIELEQRVKSLSALIAQESRRLVDPGKERGINTSIVEFESAVLEKEIAQQGYTSALASLEIARNEAARQHRYLVTVAPPSSSDEATRPHRVIGVLTVMVVSMTVLGIGALLIAAIKEHAKV